MDNEIALVVFASRTYNPSSGRWISRDRIGEYDLYNLYCYLNNSPTETADYLGYIDVKKAIERSMKLIDFASNRNFSILSGGPIILGIVPIPVAASSLRLDMSYDVRLSQCCCPRKGKQWKVEGKISLFGYLQVGLIKSKVWLFANKEKKKRQRRHYKKDSDYGTTYEPTKGMQESTANTTLVSFGKDDPCPESFTFSAWDLSIEAHMTAGLYMGAFYSASTKISDGEELTWSTIKDNFKQEAGVSSGVYGLALQLGVRGSFGIEFSIPYFVF